jgi:hypothetical protein
LDVYSVIRHQEFLQRLNGLMDENNLNLQLLKSIFDIVHKNQDKKFSSLRNYVELTTTLGLSALDHLLADHYLEEDTEFYKECHVLLAFVNTVNFNLQAWQHSKKVEDWFVSQELFLMTSFLQYGNKLKESRIKLLKAY